MRPSPPPPLALLILLVAAGLALAPRPTHAEDDVPSRFFERYDADGDGRVTAEELAADDEVFRVLDRDQDGAITRKDLGPPAAYRPRKAPPGKAAAKKRANGAAAANRRAALRKRLKVLDRDGDGKVTREEFPGKDRVFEALDRNGDGVLDAADFADDDSPSSRKPGAPAGGAANEGLRRRFRQLDENGDGRLGPDELPRPQLLKRFDKSGDGVVSLEEFLEAPRRAGDTRRRSGGLSPQAFRRFDGNGDGKVDRDEFPGSDERFDQLDTNGDGRLTDADRPAAKAGSKASHPRSLAELERRDDVDGDRRVSRREFQGTDERFDELDRNRDGYLDAQDER